jgi:hypothetical protein
MDLLDLLRRQASRFQCPNCGESLKDCKLELVAQEGPESVVRVTCTHCQDDRLIGVALASEVQVQKPVVEVRDQPPDGQPALTIDDVLDVRLWLQGHQGDLRSLLPPQPK